jgi:hypothetical protein
VGIDGWELFLVSGNSPRWKRSALSRKSNGGERHVTAAGNQDREVIAGIIGILLLCSRSKGFGSTIANDE